MKPSGDKVFVCMCVLWTPNTHFQFKWMTHTSVCLLCLVREKLYPIVTHAHYVVLWYLILCYYCTNNIYLARFGINSIFPWFYWIWR